MEVNNKNNNLLGLFAFVLVLFSTTHPLSTEQKIDSSVVEKYISNYLNNYIVKSSNSDFKVSTRQCQLVIEEIYKQNCGQEIDTSVVLSEKIFVNLSELQSSVGLSQSLVDPGSDVITVEYRSSEAKTILESNSSFNQLVLKFPSDVLSRIAAANLEFKKLQTSADLDSHKLISFCGLDAISPPDNPWVFRLKNGDHSGFAQKLRDHIHFCSESESKR